MSNPQPQEYGRVRVDTAGRVVVPAELRQKLGIEPGSDLIVSADDAGIHLRTFAQVVHDIQEALAPYRIPGQSIVDELIAERREEARRENKKWPPSD